MPWINPERLLHTLIANEETNRFLRTREEVRQRTSFLGFLERCGVMDLGELTPEQTLMFVAARNLASNVDLLRIPEGSSQGRAGHLTYDLDRPKTSLGPSMLTFMDRTPSGETDLSELLEPEDIPLAIAEDLLLRRRAPMEFLRRLTEGELLRNAYVHNIEQETAASEDPVSATTEEEGSAEEFGQFCYLLVDGSESMGLSRDRRNLVARGLALAFLDAQREAENPSIAYFFRQDLSAPVGGQSTGEFHRAVAEILRHPHEGMTNLQSALANLSKEMHASAKRIDVALITDGLTRLTQNPLDGVHLHTYLIEDQVENLAGPEKEQYSEAYGKLKEWSSFFLRFSPDILADALRPSRGDVLNAAKVLLDLDEEVSRAATAQRIRRIISRVRNLNEMVKQYGVTEDPDILALSHRVSETMSRLAALDPVAKASENLGGLTPFDRDKAVSLESRELKGLFDLRTPPGSIPAGVEEWQAWWSGFLRWIRGRFLRS